MTPTIYQWLNGDGPVSALVADRIYRSVAPDGVAKPYITWQIIGGHAEAYLSESAGIAQSLVQVDVWALDQQSRKAVANAVEACLGQYGYQVGVQMDDYEPDTKLYRMMLQFHIWA